MLKLSPLDAMQRCRHAVSHRRQSETGKGGAEGMGEGMGSGYYGGTGVGVGRGALSEVESGVGMSCDVMRYT